MSKKHVHFAMFLLPFALVACSKPAEGAAQAEPAAAPPSAEPAAAPVAGGKAFEEDKVDMIRGIAGMQAATVACQLASQAQMDAATAEQRADYVAEGYDGNAYDRLHGAAYKETQVKLNGASAAQKAQACEQMKQFGDDMRQMGEEMQKQMDAKH